MSSRTAGATQRNPVSTNQEKLLAVSKMKVSAIPLLGIYPRDTPIYNKDACTTMSIAALLIIARS